MHSTWIPGPSLCEERNPPFLQQLGVAVLGVGVSKRDRALFFGGCSLCAPFLLTRIALTPAPLLWRQAVKQRRAALIRTCSPLFVLLAANIFSPERHSVNGSVAVFLQ